MRGNTNSLNHVKVVLFYVLLNVVLFCCHKYVYALVLGDAGFLYNKKKIKETQLHKKRNLD